MTAARAIRNCTFRIGQRGTVWYVTRDAAFYGDYRSQAQAIAAACFGARAAEAQGAVAKVFDGAEDNLVPHALPTVKAKAASKSKKS